MSKTDLSTHQFTTDPSLIANLLIHQLTNCLDSPTYQFTNLPTLMRSLSSLCPSQPEWCALHHSRDERAEPVVVLRRLAHDRADCRRVGGLESASESVRQHLLGQRPHELIRLEQRRRQAVGPDELRAVGHLARRVDGRASFVERSPFADT